MPEIERGGTGGIFIKFLQKIYNNNIINTL